MTAVVDPTQHLWWLASRASGIVAIILLTYTVLVGLMMGGKLMQRVMGRPGKGALAIKQLLQTHEMTSIAALVAIGVHGVTLLGDGFLHPTISQLAIPFTIDYRSFYVGLGIIGGYVALALGLSFYIRGRIGVNTWKKMHRWTIAAYALAVGHALGAGTDAGSAWFNYPLLASAGLVAVMFLVRMSSVGRTQKARKTQEAPSVLRGRPQDAAAS
ncbi:MAG: ferric reductase-like transmembrane domain-containing protein [Thermoleophilaceae bacterium]|nr:ferric reductase-like transmembrane domain-containing protein [Thermoleophilaceae bacterium]